MNENENNSEDREEETERWNAQTSRYCLLLHNNIYSTGYPVCPAMSRARVNNVDQPSASGFPGSSLFSEQLRCAPLARLAAAEAAGGVAGRPGLAWPGRPCCTVVSQCDGCARLCDVQQVRDAE